VHWTCPRRRRRPGLETRCCRSPDHPVLCLTAPAQEQQASSSRLAVRDGLLKRRVELGRELAGLEARRAELSHRREVSCCGNSQLSDNIVSSTCMASLPARQAELTQSARRSDNSLTIH
jgi:hypothetical protein